MASLAIPASLCRVLVVIRRRHLAVYQQRLILPRSQPLEATWTYFERVVRRALVDALAGVV